MAITRRRAIVLLIAGLSGPVAALDGLSAAFADPIAAVSPDQSLIDELKSLQSTDGVPAVGLVLLDHHQPQLISAWGRTGNPGRPTADADTPFRVGSITKTFTALTAMALVEQGHLDLTAPLPGSVAAQVANPWAESQPLRLVHLLQLTAGLSDLSRLEWENQNPRPLSLAQALALDPEQRRALWTPGTRYSYSNVAPGLTALAVERSTNERFEAAVRRLVLDPLGMPTATLLRNAYLRANLPRGYRADGSTEIPYWHMTYRAFGALSATPREMGRLLTALLNDGELDGQRVIGRDTMHRLFKPTSTLAAHAGLDIGYGLGLYGKVRNGFVFYGHGGDGDGFLSRYGLLPEHGRGYFVVINADNPPALARMRSVLERYLTRDLEAPTPPSAQPVVQDRLRALRGTYYPSSVRFRVADWEDGRLPCAKIELTGTTLRFRRGQRSTQLLPVTERLFRRPADPVSTVAFIEDAGELHMQGELGNFERLDGGDSGGFIASCDSQ